MRSIAAYLLLLIVATFPPLALGAAFTGTTPDVIARNAAAAAQASANAAQSSANTAQSSAATAQSSADTAQAAANTALASILPVGSIFDFAGTTCPNGTLIVPTTSGNISRTTYAALFAAIGTTWGAGDGSTTFGRPWVPADYAAVQASSNVGTSTVGQVIAHTHTVALGNSGATNPEALNATGVAGTMNTSSTGGSANLAAGVRFLKCIKI